MLRNGTTRRCRSILSTTHLILALVDLWASSFPYYERPPQLGLERHSGVTAPRLYLDR